MGLHRDAATYGEVQVALDDCSQETVIEQSFVDHLKEGLDSKRQG